MSYDWSATVGCQPFVVNAHSVGDSTIYWRFIDALFVVALLWSLLWSSMDRLRSTFRISPCWQSKAILGATAIASMLNKCRHIGRIAGVSSVEGSEMYFFNLLVWPVGPIRCMNMVNLERTVITMFHSIFPVHRINAVLMKQCYFTHLVVFNFSQINSSI